MPEARIYSRTACPIQNGPAHVGEWIVEFEPETRPEIEWLMGWVAGSDVRQQIHLTFDSREAAEAYCRKQGIEYNVQAPAPHRKTRRTYADNYLPFPDGTPRPIYPH